MMEYQDFFRVIKQDAVPSGLEGRVIARIHAARRRMAIVRLVFFAFCTLVSLASMVPALRYIGGELNQSGFWQYASLLFSDGGSVLRAWREFVPTVLEAIPLFGVTAFLVSLFVLLGSLKLAIKQLRTV